MVHTLMGKNIGGWYSYWLVACVVLAVVIHMNTPSEVASIAFGFLGASLLIACVSRQSPEFLGAQNQKGDGPTLAGLAALVGITDVSSLPVEPQPSRPCPPTVT